MSEINMAPRLDLLRTLAALRDWEATREPSPNYPTHYPLFGACEYPHPADEMLLAVREASAMGQIEATPAPMIYGYMMRITDAGYDHIRAHDVAGEIEQEARAGQTSEDYA